MTQLDIPQISFARYLDLLKRRRWQVIPISLLGLLVGATVAFFIPRFYVAETTIEFNGPVLEVDPRGEDPMAPVVDSATVTIPATVAACVRELGWPEALDENVERRNAFINGVRERLEVQDLGPQERGRRRAHVQITYSDTDGLRAAELANKLVEIWIRTQKESLVEKADQELQDVNARIRIATDTLENAEQELASFEEINDINPQDFVGARSGTLSAVSTELNRVEDRITEIEGRVAALGKQIQSNQAKLEDTPRKVAEPVSARAASGPAQEALELATLELSQVLAALSNLKPEHPQYAGWQRRRDRLLERIQTLRGALGGVAGPVMKANPVYVALRERIDADQATREGLRTELETYRARRDRLETRRSKLPAVMRDHERLTAKRDRARETLDTLEEERRQKQARKMRLTFGDPYEVLEEAYVPQRPTEPNITLVALAGSAVGLAVAIGLILLLDVLQSTYKTVDDVERGLALPVLGTISHMTTVEQRQEVHARRTRVGVVAGAFLVLMISVVTIYYVAPTRLPTVVRDALGLLLGGPQ